MDSNKIHQSSTLSQLFKNECFALTTLKGDNVANAIEIIDKPKNIYIISKLCNGGDLRAYLTKKGQHLEEKEAIQIM